MSKANSWEVTDAFWHRVEPLVPVRQRPVDKAYVRQSGAGRKPKDARLVFEAIVFVLRTGCQWNALNVTGLCSSSSAHRRFQEWQKAGVFERLWENVLQEYDQEVGIDWSWVSVDGAMVKSPLGGKKERPQSRPQSHRSREKGRQAQHGQ